MDNQWSQWYPITSKEDPASKVGNGVYRVRATTSPGVPKEIPRACGVDRDGIMYIGKADGNKRLEKQVGALLDRQGRGGTHLFVKKTFVRYKLDRICPRTSLEVQWYEYATPRQEEQRLIDEYKEAFGDLPPGNLRRGG